jgi:hypothetical protein
MQSVQSEMDISQSLLRLMDEVQSRKNEWSYFGHFSKC